MLVLISDVSIVFYHATFNTLSMSQDIGTLVLNTINKNIGKSLQSRSLEICIPLDKLKFNKWVDHPNSIVTPRGFGKLRPISCLLWLNSHSQSKNFESSIYKQCMMLSHEANICWYWSVTSAFRLVVWRSNWYDQPFK